MKKQLLLLLITLFTIKGFSQATEIVGTPSEIFDIFSFEENLMIVSETQTDSFVLWSYNGTSTSKIATLGDQDFEPSSFVVYNGKITFIAQDIVNGSPLREINGSTVSVVSNNSGNAYHLSMGAQVIPYNNKLYFRADDLTNEYLYSYDGSTVTKVTDQSGLTLEEPTELTVFQNKLYFSYVLSGNTVFASFDGDSVFTKINTANSVNFGRDKPFINYNNKLYKKLEGQGTEGIELGIYSDDTLQIQEDIYTGQTGGSPNSSSPEVKFVFKDKLYFNVNQYEDNSNSAVFTYKDTDTSSKRDTIIGLDNQSFDISEFMIFNDKLYYNLSNNSNGNNLYVYDGTNTPSLVMDINPTNGSDPEFFHVHNNRLYFAVKTETSGYDSKVWVLDLESVSIKTNKEFETLKVFPNPTTGVVNISVNEILTYISLKDITGKQIKSFDSNATQLDVSDVTTGIYFLEVANYNKKSVIKLVVR